MKRSPQVAQLMRNDRWSVAEGVANGAPFLIRFRTPVLKTTETEGYAHLLTIVWAYAPMTSGELPDEDATEQMANFENHFVAAFEHDATSVLTAVLTFDGARQWVVYTEDVAECGRRLSAMPHGADPYPIELTTECDPNWSYLRNKILARVDHSELR